MFENKALTLEFGRLFNIQNGVRSLENQSTSDNHEIKFRVYDDQPPMVRDMLELFPWYCRAINNAYYFDIQMSIPDEYWDIKSLRNYITMVKIGSM